MYLPGTIQDRIGDLRTSKGLTQKELADRIGVAPSQLSRIGKGETQRISGDILVKLATEFNVSTDYILGLTTVPTPKSYDISELGMSGGAVRVLLTGAIDVQMLNRLMEHKNFPYLMHLIKTYFEDIAAAGIASRNDVIDFATATLGDFMKSNPEHKSEVAPDIRLLRSQKLGEHEAEIEKIKNTFIAILKDIKKDIDTEKAPEASATANFVQQLREQIAEKQSQAQSLPTAGDVSEMVLQMVKQQHPTLDEKSSELFQQLVQQMFTKPEE